MKPVIGMLLIFTGLTVGYLVLVGKLPTQQSSSVPSVSGNPTIGKSGGPSIESRGYALRPMPTVKGFAV